MIRRPDEGVHASVTLSTLRHAASETLADVLGQVFRTVNNEQTSHDWNSYNMAPS